MKNSALRSFAFADILFNEQDEAIVRVRSGDPTLSTLPAAYHDDMASFIDAVRRRARETTQREFLQLHDGANYRVSRIDAVGGIWFAVTRGLPPRPLLELGFPAAIQRKLLNIGKRTGLCLISGGSGDGKTTTACSALVEILRLHGGWALSIEDPVELPIQGEHPPGLCFQVDVHDGNFAREIKHALRQRPHYILIGEIRDPETASEALRAAVTGHLVIATIHAGSIMEALLAINSRARILDGEFASKNLAASLIAVIHQSLKKTPNKLTMDALFLDAENDESIRAKIRSGEFEQLSTEIRAQNGRIG